MVATKTFIEDDVVISGMSGRFPECDSIEEFYEKLFSGIDLVHDNDTRWPKGYLNTYSKFGFIKDLRNFDATFFGAHPKLAERTDPIVRTLLETSVEAVMDAGICPTALRGSETGVIVAVSSNEAADWWSADPDRVNGYEFLGCTRTMYSNRISFVMDLKGPSYTMDSQSSSGLLGVQQAYYMLKTGMVDAVIVAGVNLVLNPHFNIMFKKLNMLSADGKCKVFDANADGYVRSEAGVAILMQRKADAKRFYATVVGTESNCDGFKEYGCNTESLSSQIKLYRETLERFRLNPLDVSFVEAHGYATLDGDRTELTGITEVFCKGREDPLLIGSVKSNMGHSEPVGGLVSVVKILLAMEAGILPPNLHFKTPNPEISALKDGRLKVVDKLTVWNGKYAAINSFGIGGTNSHLILKRNEKEKKLEKITIPRLMIVSGRTESAVTSLLNRVKSLQADNEFCSLLYGVFSSHIPHFNYRAFSVFDDEQIMEIATYTAQDTSRPVCFVFSGMGSQWPGMCKKLLEFENFRITIDACAAVLKTVDFDLYALFNSVDRKVFDNVLNSFVGITCAQIAFVNLLYELGIKPDYIIGHSIGELACAYADETLTLEQTVLATYWRGQCLLMTDLEAGAMAAVGLSANEVSKRLPTDITIACHNSSDSITISGPPKSINNFTKILQDEGIFAREVNSSGYAFHSQYISKVGPAFKSTLEKIIPQPKPRTKRWISTSVPEDSWNTPLAQYSSVAYHLNNLLSPVMFDKALAYVPENTVVIEISPHALLQSILKGSLSSNCTHVGLVRRNHASVTDLLISIGRLYNAGLQPNLNPLYPTVNFPVSRKTPMIQSMVEWDHSIKWFLVSFLTKSACFHGEIETDVDITDERYKFLTDCVIDEIPTFPISGYICLLWEAVAKLQVSSIAYVPVVIENFQLLRKCTLTRDKSLKFTINILENSGECEIKESGIPVARANIKIVNAVENEFSDPHKTNSEYDNFLPLKPADFYLDLYQKGYMYKKQFRAVKYSDNKGEHGIIKWANNWMIYIEAMLQMHLIRLNKQKLFSINYIQKVIIDPSKHVSVVDQVNPELGLLVDVFPAVDVIKSGGIELRGVKSTLVSLRSKQPEPVVEYYAFIPHMPEEVIDLEKAINICTQLVCENSSTYPILKTAEVVIDSSAHVYLTSQVAKIIDREPYVVGNFTLISKKSPLAEQLSNVHNIVIESKNGLTPSPSPEKYNFIMTTNIFSNSGDIKNILQSLVKDGFLLTLEDAKISLSEDNSDEFGYKLIAKFNTTLGICLLIRKTPVWKTPMVVYVKNDGFGWIDGVKMALKKHKIDKRNTMIIFHGNDPTGIIGFMKCVLKEPFGTGLRCLFTDNSINPYKIVDLFYINHFRKGLVFNVYKDGHWGSYRHLPAEKNCTVECEHAFIGPKEVGDFASLSYIEGRMPYINIKNYPNHELCYVYYSSIYAHDIRSALGHLPYDDYTNVTKQGSVLGHEYSGRDSRGKRVFGMVGGGALATTVLADSTVMWDVPDHWTLEQASTVPRVYSVAYYALIMRAQLQKGEMVYINAGVMGLCVACLNVSLGVGAVPFIGFNNQIERKYLRDTFPELPETSFINLEESSFEYQLLTITDGRGVDVIFDILNSHKRYLFLDALAHNGRLVEFEKNTLFNESLGYAAVEKNITFHKISHNTLWVSDSGKEDRKEIQKLVTKGVCSGVVKPIVTNIFTEDQVEEAFRVAQSGKFIGKIVIKFRDEEPEKIIIPKTKIVKAYPSTFLNPNLSYIVTTGLSELGIQLVDWLISRGANKIILQSHYKPVTGYQCLAVRRWKKDNINFTLSNADASTLTGAEKLIKTASELGSVGGIFHIGHVAGEFNLQESCKSYFQLVWKTKVETAKHLDILSRKMCPKLKYFVGFSDVVSSFGASRKCMFGYSCSEMEMIFEQRKAEDYPSIVIQNGVLDKFDADVTSAQSLHGFAPIKFSSILKILPVLLNQDHVVLSVYIKESSSEICTMPKVNIEAMNNATDILGIKSLHKFYTTTFGETGVEPLVLEKMQKFLENYGITADRKSVV